MSVTKKLGFNLLRTLRAQKQLNPIKQKTKLIMFPFFLLKTDNMYCDTTHRWGGRAAGCIPFIMDEGGGSRTLQGIYTSNTKV